MNIRTARFLLSAVAPTQFPKNQLPEFAFIGRSNVGKSSLINMLTARGGLAKTSAVPGKTRALNYFVINDEWYLVDMPGYGYSKTSKTQRESFQILITAYFQKRSSLACAFVLIDCRHEPLEADISFLCYLGELQVPFTVVFTKADKLTRPQLEKNLSEYKAEILKYFEELPPVFCTSSSKKTGRNEILEFIGQTFTAIREN